MTDNSDESAGLNQFTSEWFDPEDLLQEMMQQKRAQRIADAATDKAENHIAPRTLTEQKLADIWAELLEVERVGVDDDFFKIGGNSLLATQLLSRMCHAFEMDIPMRALFMGKTTVAEFAKFIDGKYTGVDTALPGPADAALRPQPAMRPARPPRIAAHPQKELAPRLLLITKGTGGDLFPFLRIGELLQARGHAVTLLTHSYYAEQVAASGLEFAALDDLIAFQQMAQDQSLLETPQDTLTYYRRHILPRLLPEIESVAALTHNRAAVLIANHDTHLLVRTAAEYLQIPFISIVLAPGYFSPLPVLEALHDCLSDELNALRGQLSLPPVTEWGSWFRTADQTLALWPDWFAPINPTWPADMQYVGFLSNAESEKGELPPEAHSAMESAAPVLITHGTSLPSLPEFYAMSAAACQKLGQPGLLVTRHATAIPHPLPDAVKWIKQAPFASLMPQMQAVIHHAGVGTLAQALLAGVPQLALAVGFDRPENAMHLQELGVGEYLPPARWQPDEIAAALQRLTTSTSVRERCRELQARLQKTDSARVLCEAIETVLPHHGAAAPSTDKMKILLVQNATYIPTFGGANKANRLLVEGLAARNHECRVIAPAYGLQGFESRAQFLDELKQRGITVTATSETLIEFETQGVRVQAVTEMSALNSLVEQQAREFEPTWVVVSSEDPGQILLETALRACPERVLYLSHTLSLLPFGPESLFPSPYKAELFQRISKIFAFSKYVQTYIHQWGGLETQMLRYSFFGAGPFPQFGRFDNGYITLVNPCAYKGLSIFLALARALPNLPFAAVPTWGATQADLQALAALPNVKIINATQNMDEIFAQTRLLLTPSLWPESFGLVVVEAMARGIPVLASDLGGLPEAKLGVDYLLPVSPIEKYEDRFDERLNPIAIVPEQDIKPWLQAIQRLLTDQEHYEHLSQASREAAVAFLAEVDFVDAFEAQVFPSPVQNQPELAQLTPQPRSVGTTFFPLSFAQERLWFLDQLEPGNPTYNAMFAYRLSGSLDQMVLEQSLNAIIQRHEVLRTTFVLQNDHPVQQIAPMLNIKIEMLDLGQLPATELHQQLRNEAHRPFDLAYGPLIRAILLRQNTTEQVLLLALHHSVGDGWSMSLFLDEISTLYNSYLAGKQPNLPSLPIQYADFAHWQRELLQGAYLEQQMAYWKRQLAGAPPELSLPTDHARPETQSMRGASFAFALPLHLTQSLQTFSQQESVSLFMSLLAAFQVLLYRYSGQTDVVVGTTSAARLRPELERLIGFFANTLVLRTDLSGNISFRELLAQVRSVVLGAQAHQDLPFEKLVSILHPERSLNRTPLFQVMFSLQNKALPLPIFGDLEIAPLDVETTTAKFDLNVSLIETASGLQGYAEYSADLFERATIERMLAHWQTVIAQMIAHPEENLSDFSVLNAAELEKIVVEWNATETEYAQGKFIHQLFEAQVEQTPEAVAVVFDDQQLTYRQLNTKANQLAHYLQTRGVGPDVLVGICVERSLEMVIGLFGILKAGGAYVPLDPSYPTDRLLTMLDDAKPAILLTQQHLQLTCPVADFCLDSQSAALTAYPDTNPQNELQPGNLAYVIYTSGSTGKPKGVGIDHAGILNRLQWMQSAYKLTTADRVLQKTPFSFDVSVWEFFWPLANGSALVIAAPGGHQDPDYLAATIEFQSITTLHFVPPMLEAFLNSIQPTHFTRLRQVICSGQALPLELQQRFFTKLPGVALHNLYGPTEASVDVTFWQCQPETTLHCVPIGHPIANIQMYVLDANLHPVPVGVAGELYIAGIGLARGYINRPDLTAEKFVPNPFVKEDGGRGTAWSTVHSRMYRTGDLARYLPTLRGSIEYLGRIDQQVKIRGFRIELGEIESTLAALSEIRDVVVLAREDRLVAYLVAQPGYDLPETTTLRSKLAQSLPEYMIPAHFIALGELPITPNGKVNHKALPAPGMTRSRIGYIAPRTPTEETLAQIWADVLKLDKVGIYDNFFGLGGDSIRTIEIVSKARKHGLVLKLEHIFRQQTIADLVKALSLKIADKPLLPVSTPDVALIADADRARLPEYVEDAYAMSRLQLGMIFHNQLTQELGTYHDVFSFRLKILQWDHTLFDSVLRALMQKHPILRTSFRLNEYSEPLQLVHKESPIPVKVFDLTAFDTPAQDKMIADWIDIEKRTAFDLETAPLLRIFIHHRSADTLQYTISFHHAIIDGWSVASLQAELFGEYIRLSTALDKTLVVEPLASSFKKTIAAELRALQCTETKSFWGEYLAGHTLSTLPAFEDDGQPSTRNTAELPIGAELGNNLIALANALNVPLRTVLLTAHLRVMSMLSGKDDVVTGLTVNNRLEEQDGDKVLGLFLNMLPLRQVLHKGSWAELIRLTFENELAVTPYRAYPYAQLLLENGRVPLFETSFNYINFHVYDNLRQADSIEVLDATIFEATNFAMTLNASNQVGNLQLSLVFDPARLSATQVEKIAGYYLSVLQSMTTYPDARHDTQNHLSDTERRQILVDWNATETEYSQGGQCIHELFEAQAQKTPEAIAVVFDGQHLTYAELNAKSNQLAHYLHSQGVGPDMLVGICVERSLEMIVGLLGILKAGGAYLPLDPNYPKDRLAYMLEDARPAILLTQGHLQGTLSINSFCLDNQWDELNDLPRSNLPNMVLPGNLVYIIYTSGSTGKPKGVQITHGALVASTLARIHYYASLGRYLLLSSLSFDSSVAAIFGTLLSANTLILPHGDSVRDPFALRELIQTLNVTTLLCVPSLYTELLRNFHANHAQWTLTQVIVAGEACPVELPWASHEHFPATKLFNEYGPTEATVWASVYQFLPDIPQRISPIGRPIANTHIYILDSTLNPVPVGVAGELYIAGAGLARGYLKRPDLTAEKFIPNPFEIGGARMYRTGDLARWLPASRGNIEYLGRIDSQVKDRGFRIELGEIEAALLALPEVRDVVVLAREDTPGGTHLVAYLVAQPSCNLPETAVLRSKLAQSLPDYMIPAHFMSLEQLPLTPNGKVDRKALPAPDMIRSEVGYVAPRTPVEETLAHIWADVLKLDKIGIHDNFFDLGGHSLLATQVVSRLFQAFQVELPLRVLFEASTLETLAAWVDTEFQNLEDIEI